MSNPSISVLHHDSHMNNNAPRAKIGWSDAETFDYAGPETCPH